MIPLPSKPKIVEKKGENKALFKIESLYPGYGVTVGNSMRRVLLSSLSGAAVTKVKIEGVNHEFSTISGVMEDVITIILNLKELRFRVHSDESQSAKLKTKGEKEVKGSDLELPTQVEIKNPDAHIATLTNKSSSLEMEVEIERGIGYSSAEERKEEKLEIGQIMVDSVFTPVRRANFYVENMRVGKRTDFDRLFIEVETDGTVSPEEALSESANILTEHFSLLSSFEEAEEGTEKAEEKESSSSLALEDLNLKTRTLNILKEGGVNNIEELTGMTEKELSDLKGMGEKSVQEVKKALEENGLELKQ